MTTSVLLASLPSGTTSPPTPPAAPAGGPGSRAAAGAGLASGVVPRGPGAVVLLVYNPPEDPAPCYGLGWTLVAWQTNSWCWSLAARGAGPHTDARSAHATATRLLAARGARVETWHDGGHDALAMFPAPPSPT